MAREGQSILGYYVPTELKEAWAERSRVTGRSEVELIERVMRLALSLPPDMKPGDPLPAVPDPVPWPEEKARPKRGPAAGPPPEVVPKRKPGRPKKETSKSKGGKGGTK